MIVNEVRDKFQTGRVFDLNDIYASIAGVTFSAMLFNISRKENYRRQSTKKNDI